LVLLCAVLGFVAFELLALSTHSMGRAVAGWTPVAARVVATEVRARGSVYEPMVRYEYELPGAGTRYRSDRLALTPVRYRRLLDAQRVVDETPVGTGVTAHVDPSHPEHAVLRTEVGKGLSGFLVGGGVAWLLVWSLCWRALARPSRAVR
jgi:hypothetical protein